MTSSAARLSVSPAQRQVLEKVARSSSAAHREVLRARVLLAGADGLGNKTAAARYGVTSVTVRAWRTAFETDGLTGWGKVKEGRGRRPRITEDRIA